MTKRAAKAPSAESPKLRPLTDKQARFADEYLIDLDASAAAVRAGYSAKTRWQIGYQLLQNPSVAAAIRERAGKREQRTQITADVVLSEFFRIARVDIAGAFEENGDLKPIHEIPEDIRRAVAGIEVEALFEGAGKDREQIGFTKKLKFWDKNRALESLAKHLGLLVEKHEHFGPGGAPLNFTFALDHAGRDDGSDEAASG